MRFGMGEVFQFSSPYKWRCSKRFYRLFVYCSWLLIARDNSTGFTIQWGTGVNFSSSTIYITLPRTFTAFRSVVAVPGNTHGYGGIRANINSNSNIRMYSNSTGDGENTSWVALGFT
ncbi:gp53-like domain-containing protein [Parasutterella excrementihominis]|uniref:gp53-like domain-containing protein n=1 Tax=Parasutterella excrementihominis TaxID=487175 RepID=UPI003AF8E190